MPSYGTDSQREIDTCHAFIQRVLHEVILDVDISIVCGYRDEATQTAYFGSGRSKVEYPNSRHNIAPSMAIDFAPYPIDWGDEGSRSEREKARARFYFCAGVIKAVTMKLNRQFANDAGAVSFVPRFGLDWDGDMDFTDQKFDDLGHVEWKMVPTGVIRNG